jgi:predicted RNA-binding Zn-ribbon protein involved in translation (DUF1610 family)
MIIYAPYKRKDGRVQLDVVTDNGKKTTMSYPKYLVQRFTGRKLDVGETIDHIDGDFTNNWVSNLRIVTMSEHASDDNIRAKPIKFICPMCGMEAEKRARKVVSNRKQGKAGPFCSRNCAARYGRQFQLGRVKPEDIEWPVIERTYYFKEKGGCNIQYETDVDLEALFREDFKTGKRIE